jgi:signal transduction histidine kinase
MTTDDRRDVRSRRDSSVRPKRDRSERADEVRGDAAATEASLVRLGTQLRESTAELDAIARAFSDLYFYIDAEGRYVGFRASQESDLYARPPAFIGKRIDEVLPPEVGRNCLDAVSRVVATGEPVYTQYSLPMPAGVRSFEAKIVPLPLRKEAPVLAVVRDVTERKRAEERLVQSERLAAIGQTVAALAHEYGNALQMISGAIERLRLRFEDEPRARELVPEALDLLEQMQRAQGRMQRLSDDVRSFAAPLHLERARWDLGEILRATWSDLAPSRAGRDTSLRELGETGDLECEVDRIFIEQVFRNILENSLAACEGRVEIEVEWADAAIGEASAVRAAIRDDGPGLSPEAREKIFEPFYTTKAKGTGLGMAIAQRIVAAHGGTIEVGGASGTVAETGARRGAEIVVTLPREGR